jgi:Ferredoxin-like domain in Api92-like protein
MPNHVTTRCIVTGPANTLSEFTRRHIVPDREDSQEAIFDFNTVIPRPSILDDVEAGGSVTEGLVALGYEEHAGESAIARVLGNSVFSFPRYKEAGVDDREKLRAHLEQFDPGALEEARRAAIAIDETGYRDWYHWSIDQWGTKWNSYGFHFVSSTADRVEFRFDTAWSFPKPIFRRLAGMYPSLTFEVASMDPAMDWGARGQFNGADDFCFVCANDELYEVVYGYQPEPDDDYEYAPSAPCEARDAEA